MEFIPPILLLLAFLYFRIGPGSKMLKKKSHHYQTPPDPEKDPDWHPIKVTDYHNFICLKQTTLDYIEYKTSIIIPGFTDDNSIIQHFESDWFIIHNKQTKFL